MEKQTKIMEKLNNREAVTGILGLGNMLLSDEGFGCHVIHYLEANYSFPDQIQLKDGGTAGIYMVPFLESCSQVFVVDIVSLDADPGSVHYLSRDDLNSPGIQRRMSPHQLGILEMLDICQLRDKAPESVEYFCVVPESLATGLELSASVAPRVSEVGDKIVERLRLQDLDVSSKKEQDNA